jgi:hypothetical protein
MGILSRKMALEGSSPQNLLGNLNFNSPPEYSPVRNNTIDRVLGNKNYTQRRNGDHIAH